MENLQLMLPSPLMLLPYQLVVSLIREEMVRCVCQKVAGLLKQLKEVLECFLGHGQRALMCLLLSKLRLLLLLGVLQVVMLPGRGLQAAQTYYGSDSQLEVGSQHSLCMLHQLQFAVDQPVNVHLVLLALLMLRDKGQLVWVPLIFDE
jgi:hypothetical protein